MPVRYSIDGFSVHYRIGSLEKMMSVTLFGDVVHYRIGSLEK